MNDKKQNNNWSRTIIAILLIVTISILINIIEVVPIDKTSIDDETNSEYTETDYDAHSHRGTRSIINVPGDYPTIQEAINASFEGDTIIVASGTYNENIFINKSISLIGESKENTIIDGGNNGNVVCIFITNWVNISGFKITNSGTYDFGIEMQVSSNCNISDCDISSNYGVGIHLVGSSYNIIANNNIYSNGVHGIYMIYECIYNEIINNTIDSNNGSGIILYGYLDECRHNTIYNNIISNNYYGVYLWPDSPDNQVHYNNIYDNLYYGGYVSESPSRVNATYNWWGNSSGPYHFTQNPLGNGNNVSDYVDFKPWLTIPFDTTIDYIQIRTTPESSGPVAESHNMTTDEIWQLWAGSYNYTMGYMEDLSVTWNVTGDIGLVSPIIGPSTTFYPTQPGNVTIAASYDTFITQTGDITVSLGILHHINITPLNWIMFLNESKQFFAKGYDSKNNEVTISPTWETNSHCSITNNGTFIADAVCLNTWTIYANQSNISGTASVTILVSNTTDIDSDEMPDWWEVEHSLNPFNESDAALDHDLDGLSNLQEFLNYSNPNNNDTDGDNLGDGFEVIFSKTNASLWDTNGNGIGDGLEFIQSKGYLGWIESLPDDWIGMTITWDNYTILIKTNSSVLEGEFDKEEQKLKIKVSGPNGTQGVTKIDVPKTLCEPEDIEIKLDGELINYTVTEDETYYYIHIEYNHSIHELSMEFGKITEIPSEEAEDKKGFLADFYQIALIIAIIIILALLILIIKIRSEKENIGLSEVPPERLRNLLEKKYAEGNMTDETYEDIKSLLKKYRSG